MFNHQTLKRFFPYKLIKADVHVYAVSDRQACKKGFGPDRIVDGPDPQRYEWSMLIATTDCSFILE